MDKLWEFGVRLRKMFLPDYFEYSHYLLERNYMEIIARSCLLITSGSLRVKNCFIFLWMFLCKYMLCEWQEFHFLQPLWQVFLTAQVLKYSDIKSCHNQCQLVVKSNLIGHLIGFFKQHSTELWKIHRKQVNCPWWGIIRSSGDFLLSEKSIMLWKQSW